MLDQKVVLADIDAALNEYKALREASEFGDCSDRGKLAVTAMNTRLATTIERYADSTSRYVKGLLHLLGDAGLDRAGNIAALAGILSTLRADIAANRLQTFTELIHADVFSDFLEMADHLLREGYKDPAAVLAGGVLEQHLRALCEKHALSPSAPDGSPKKADLINAELAKIPAYSKLDQKNVTAWLGLRNDAAHANYGAYQAQQVALLVQSIRDFITRIPA